MTHPQELIDAARNALISGLEGGGSGKRGVFANRSIAAAIGAVRAYDAALASGGVAAWDVEKNISVVCGKCNGQWYWPLTRGELVLDPAEVVCVSCYGAWDVSPVALAGAPEGGEE
jgi:hypothetical protein